MMQVMAVALSESASEADQARAVEGQEATDMLRAKQLSLSMAASSGAAEALSFKLWDTDWCVSPECRMGPGLTAVAAADPEGWKELAHGLQR